MIKNHLKIALRNLLKQKYFAVANVFGLALGIAAAFILLLFVMQQFSYDRGFDDSERIYRVATDFYDMGGFAKSQMQMLEFLPATTPAFENGTRFDRGFKPAPVIVDNRTFNEPNYFEVDSSYFQIFNHDFLEGSSGRLMSRPDEVVLSDRLAEKYFGDAPALGKVIEVGRDRQPYQVVGVVKSPDFETHLAPDMWLSLRPDTAQVSTWTNIAYYNYIKLKPGTTAGDLEAGLDRLMEQQAFPMSGFDSLDEWKASKFAPKFWVQPLKDIHLHSDFNFEVVAGGNATLVYVLGSIGLFILLIAGVNYINLTTAASSSRVKEIGVKQSLGIERKTLIVQFLVESVVFSLFAMVLATGLSEVLLGIFQTITGTVLIESLFSSAGYLFALVGFSVAIGLLAGLYPAIYLSGFKPIKLLKSTWIPRENQRVRSGLVVFQFSIAIILLIGSFIVQQQLTFMMSTDKGFEHEGVMVIENMAELGQQTNTFRNQLDELPPVAMTSYAGRVPSSSDIVVTVYSTPEMEEGITIQTFSGDENYLPALALRLVDGRNFSGDLASDSNAVIINEAAVRALELGDEPVGRELNGGQRVVGVVSDFNYQSLREGIEPVVILYNTSGGELIVKVQGNAVAELLTTIQSIWQSHALDEPMRYTFLDDNFASMAVHEQTLSKTISLFTLMAILIACIGLFGLTTYSVKRRTKEIGIRKVVGASAGNLVGMLSKDFLKLIVWAFAIAAPVSFLAISRWLEGFAYHIDPTLWVFLLAGALAVGTAFLTLSFQTIRAARSNPVEALRYE